MIAGSQTDDRWLRLPEAASYLGVGYRTVIRYHEDRHVTHFPSHGTGKRTRVRRSDLDRWYPAFLDRG